MYAIQYAEWIETFGRDQILFIHSEEFYRDTPTVMERVGEFLGLEPFDWESVTGKAFNIINPHSPSAQGQEIVSNNNVGLFVGGSSRELTSQYPPLPPRMRAQLSALFQPYNEALATLTGEPNYWPPGATGLDEQMAKDAEQRQKEEEEAKEQEQEEEQEDTESY